MLDLSFNHSIITNRDIPTAATIGISARVGQWIGRIVTDRTKLHKALADKIPDSIQQGMGICSDWIASPITRIHGALLRDYVNELFLSTVVAPITEECIYRLGLQQGVNSALVTVGAPPMIADCTSILSSSVLFGMAHSDNYLSTDQFVAIFTTGIFLE